MIKNKLKKEKPILIINVCKEQMHYFEFVKPIEDIVFNFGKEFITKHYSKLNSLDVEKASKIIICGTSLRDNDFLDKIEQFKWIKDYPGKILGICAGMQIIGRIYGGKIKNKKEVGYFNENFEKEFLGLFGNQEVYHLHNNYIDFSSLKEFDIFSTGEIIQAVKCKDKEIYGVLFHPEVRNKSLILSFINL